MAESRATTGIDESIGLLGFGCMRLPKTEGVIDIEQTCAMVDAFLAAGFNYFDTAWSYDGSEEAVGKALVARYPRERYLLATKLAPWAADMDAEKVRAQFDQSLARTGVEYFDFYLLHNYGQNRSARFDEYDVWSFAQEKKAEGKVRHVGISAHCSAEELDAMLTAHPEMEFVELQINYADWESPTIQARACYEVARRHQKPVIVMEPVKGGMLATPPEAVASLLEQAEPGSTPASWALRYAASLEGVLTVLSGMSSLEQVEENCRVLGNFQGVSDAERACLQEAEATLKSLDLIPCTACGYCVKVCPETIAIPQIFDALNHYTLYHNLKRAQGLMHYDIAAHDAKGAEACIFCGACVEVCPQSIPVRGELVHCREVLGD